jgi:CPA2 family monovalent cation:H+ antiporter-2
VGVVLLLFEVGIEINPIRLAREGRRLLWLSPLQVLVTWAISSVVCFALGLRPAGAALVGLSIAMSSSVVVVNITRSRRRTTDARTDDVLLGWSVIQDLVGVSSALILLVVIGLGGRSGLASIAGVLAFAALAAIAAVLLPWLLRRLQTDHDLFLLVSVASGLLLAGLGSLFFGIPLALAAFVAGLAITESTVAAEARQRLLPFRDLFAVMFFVALGTLLDPARLRESLPWLLTFLGLVAVAKVLVVWIMARFARIGARAAQLALGLGQVGEFSYVLGAIALGAGLISPAVGAGLVGAVVISIAASSILVRFAHRERVGSNA